MQGIKVMTYNVYIYIYICIKQNNYIINLIQNIYRHHNDLFNVCQNQVIKTFL